MSLLDEGTTTCCYANSQKHWVTDPQGVAWEHFHTLRDIPVFSERAPKDPARAPAAGGACCAGPADHSKPAKAAASCCA
jgi:lactoylglutathione lyase